MSEGTNESGYAGQWSPTDDTSDFNKHVFLITQMLARLSTATLVQVKAVTNSGALSPVGNVDVLPLVNMLDGAGNATEHGTVYNIPYFRLQGGANAVIIDPQVGDIGIAVFADRDISAVKANKAQSNPGSRRRFNMADALYLGGFLNGTPTQYVQFTDTGMKLADINGNIIDMGPTGIAITGNVSITGNVLTLGTLMNNGLDVGSTHVHSGVTTGGGTSGPPI